MKNYFTSLLFTFLIIHSLSAQYPFSLPGNIIATLNINTSSQENFNNLLLGTNIMKFNTATEKDLIREFEPITVRFPHGLWSNWYDWEQDKTRLYGTETFQYIGNDGTLKTKTVDRLESIKKFEANNIKVGINGLTQLNNERKASSGKGFDMMWTFNMSADGTNFNNGSPVTMARYNNLVNRGFEVKYIELGNECFYPGQRSSIIPNASEYIKSAKAMSAALNAAYPNIKVSIPVLRRPNWANPNWNEDLTEDLSYFDAVSVHTYVGSNPDDDNSGEGAYADALTARKGLASSIDDYAGKVAPNKPVWLTEWGVKSGGANAVSVLGMADCYLFMSENQNRYHRANWFSLNGKLNSFLAWETYISPSGVPRPRIKYPLQKTAFGSAYEIIRSVFENSTLLSSNMNAPELEPGVDAISARAVVKNGKTTLIVLNLTNKNASFNVKLDGSSYNGSFSHKAMSFNWMGQEQVLGIDENPLSTVKVGSGAITLPKFSINTIVLNNANVDSSEDGISAFLTSPSSNAMFNVGEIIQLKANASAVAGIKQVNFRINGEFHKADVTAPYQKNWTPTSVGTYSIDVVAIDTNEERFVSESINVTIKQPKKYVQLIKSNATDFAIDGGVGASDGQNIKLWSNNSSNVNQQWEEISRGANFYSYKKNNTHYCMDGGSGAQGQNIKLKICDHTNKNQHWKKINVGDGKFHLQKRNSTGFAISGGSGGANNQNVNLWTSNSNNGNQRWIVKKIPDWQVKSAELIEYSENSAISIYPNPANGTFQIELYEIDIANIFIYDISGKLIYETTTSDNILYFSTGEKFTSGIYLIKVVANTREKVYHKKLIIE